MKKIIIVSTLAIFFSGCFLGGGSSDYEAEYGDGAKNRQTPVYQDPTTPTASTALPSAKEYSITFTDVVVLNAARNFDLVKEQGESDYKYQVMSARFIGNQLVLTYRREGTFDLQAIFDPSGDWGRNVISKDRYELNNVFKISGGVDEYVVIILLENEEVVEMKVGQTSYKISGLRPQKTINKEARMLDMREYLVRKGDNLTSIATENGLTVDEILAAPENKGKPFINRKNNYLREGEVVFLPIQ